MKTTPSGNNDTNPQPLTRRRFIQRTAAASAITAFGATTLYAEGPLQPPVTPVLMSVEYTFNNPGPQTIFPSLVGNPPEPRQLMLSGVYDQIKSHMDSIVSKGFATKNEDWQNKPYGKEKDETGCVKLESNPAMTILFHKNPDGTPSNEYDWGMSNTDPIHEDGTANPDGHVTIKVTYCIGFV